LRAHGSIDREEEDMIARTWRGKALAEKADEYQRHFTAHVAPHLKELAGHRGAYLLRRQDNGEVEFLAVTLWDSIESVRAFAGQDPDVAIVEPAGRAALSSFDDFARHYDIAHNDA
jgi:heme-degrading monooxygenase HmoA